MTNQKTLEPFDWPIAVDIEELKTSRRLDCAMSVTLGLALPDVRSCGS